MVLNKHNYAFNQLWGLTHSSSYSKKNPKTKTRTVWLLNNSVYLKDPTFCHLSELGWELAASSTFFQICSTFQQVELSQKDEDRNVTRVRVLGLACVILLGPLQHYWRSYLLMCLLIAYVSGWAFGAPWPFPVWTDELIDSCDKIKHVSWKWDPKKCELFQKEVTYLNTEGISTDKRKCERYRSG